MKLDRTRGAPPLYLQIKKLIREKIESEEYEYGMLIPTEPEFERLFDVSRITVRQAINELQMEGFVRRIRGKGTEVIYTKTIHEELQHIVSFTEELRSRGIEPGTLSTEFKEVMIPPDIAKEVSVPLDTEMFQIKRVRTADGKPIVLFNSYVTAHPNLPRNKEAYTESVYELITSKTGQRPVTVYETFGAIAADDEMAKALQVKKGSPILHRLRKSYDQFGQFLECTYSYYRGDAYKYSIVLHEP